MAEELKEGLSTSKEVKKYTAHLVGYHTTSWGYDDRDIQVDSREEAQKWCDANTYMGGNEWFIHDLVENKHLLVVYGDEPYCKNELLISMSEEQTCILEDFVPDEKGLTALQYHLSHNEPRKNVVIVVKEVLPELAVFIDQQEKLIVSYCNLSKIHKK